MIAAAQTDPSCFAFGYAGCRAARLSLRAVCADIAIIDYDMREALSLCGELSAEDECRPILINVPEDSERAVDALSAGARGVMFASEPMEDIPRAMHIVRRDQIWSPRHVIVALWMRLRSETAATSPSAREPEIVDRLSLREREVLRYAAAGLANKEVATRLSI
ncbi:MAG TPA: LuxR C-terminal-related transcriptional regulator, partial [Vicinamibacterales bacterium]|nr:LuxR C-terminal-related transcriptional regulator [Vicinamibacterales bacterium]